LGRLSASFILGYHGCERSVGEAVVAGNAEMNASASDFDWLGKGIYFWEADPIRAQEWAKWRVLRREFEDPLVIGAVIDLRNCLDLTTREDLELVKSSHDVYCKQQKLSGFLLPKI
jgi:hypothetical protein